MTDWRNLPPTEAQMEYIALLHERSEYQMPPFDGTTRGEAADYIDRCVKLAHEDAWAIVNGY